MQARVHAESVEVVAAVRRNSHAQGRLEGCPLGKALWTTTGGKARNAILQAIKACEFQNSCNCKRNIGVSKAFPYITEKETGTTSREAQES